MKKISIILALIVGLTVSCSKDFLETAPTNEVSETDVFKTAAGAQTVLDGVSRKIREYNTSHDDFGHKALDMAWDLMGEDIVCRRSHWFVYDYQIDNRQASYRRSRTTWQLYYIVINNVNNILVNADNISWASAAQEASIKGQAMALRAFAYYNLVTLYQFTYIGHENAPGVPIYTEPTTEGHARASVQEVYDLIVDDLDGAISMMTANPSPRRHISDIDVTVARGLKARVALEMGNWSEAESQARLARADYDLNSVADFSAGFADYQQSNWMWGLQLNDEQSTIYASWFSHLDMSIGGYAGLGYMPKYMSTALYNQLPADDVRKTLCVGATYSGITYYINYKFNAALAGKEFAADYVMMRPEEMLLIEAEAIARQGGRNAAVQALLDELHAVRQTAPVAVTATGTALLDLVLLERRFELWGEGFRGRDIKRL
ncbi:MAG: RagB/SusD family nutrient uptake outer membrane protein, partial [Bacteroidales bacterium]|nr:RagB/SusD family nutrient uptake outer membrane protein [Bacteroidales bacterium]